MSNKKCNDDCLNCVLSKCIYDDITSDEIINIDQADLSFVEYMHKVRVNKRISVYKLSKLSGVSTGTIFKWEKGKMQPSLKLADKLLKALGVGYVIGSRDSSEKSV